MEENKAKLYQVDSFTGERFKGNPAGVCFLYPNQEINDELMQNIAMEMNLSETAFVKPLDSCIIKLNSVFGLRWFTPATEVSLCGHGTLATAHILFEHIGVETDELTFQSLSGNLIAVKDDKGIRLDFPAGKPEKRKKPAKIIESMSISDDDYEDIQYCPNTKFLLIKLKDENLVKEIKPDFNKMISNDIDSEGIKSVIITAKSEGKYDFISRCFAPWEGVNEDPVTGSAHTVLASFWTDVLNKTSFLAYQSSKRGGELKVKLAEGNSRVHLTGEAVTVFESEIEV